MDMSHFHQFQYGEKGDDHLYFRALTLQEIAEAEFPMGTGKIFDLYHLIRQTDLFLLNGSEFASDRINLVFLPADDRLVDCIQLLQCETCQKFLWIYRLSVLQYLLRKSGLFKEYICRIVHLVL